MLLVRASVRPSPIHGLGCFTEEPINKGQMVWVYNPKFDLTLPTADLERFPEAAQSFLQMYGYFIHKDGQEYVVLCGDHSKHMNHSDEPNLSSCNDPCDSNIALRDIAPGEELTCDYYEFDADADRKLGR